MKIQKTIKLDKTKVELLEAKYPGKPFTQIVDMLMDLGLMETNNPTALKHIGDLGVDYNKLKKVFIQFRAETDERLDRLENHHHYNGIDLTEV
jgi:hypothetical protein